MEIKPHIEQREENLAKLQKHAVGKIFFNDPAIFDSQLLKYIHQRYQGLFELIYDDITTIRIYYQQVQEAVTQSADLTVIIAACIFFINISWWSSFFCFHAAVICRVTMNETTFTILFSIVYVNAAVSILVGWCIFSRIFSVYK